MSKFTDIENDQATRYAGNHRINGIIPANNVLRVWHRSRKREMQLYIHVYRILYLPTGVA